MSDDRFQIVMQTFERALEVDAPRRAEFVRREVGHDAELLAEVESLLEHHNSGGSAVATGAGLAAVGRAGVAPSIAKEALALPVLTGNYRVLRTIGEGGMGIVFEAEQAFPRRRVALKAVRPGMNSRALLRRFRNEVELLGRLQHPGIAQLYEAGVADEASPDQAFFAMELVEGRPLTQHANENGLNHKARWELLLKVCDAVQHAHQRGVIHRDLKPGNILVGSDGQPKVVDFGIARACEESNHASMATRTGQLIGTPSYMSPEQMRGEEVDTRSDVYALGIVAYELLAGRLPFDLTTVGLPEASRMIREDEPPPPSRFDKSLRGDAEVIILKAIAKEPDRRYASAGAFGEDIQRFLAGDAIAARRDSAMYLLRKQMRRHRTAARLVVLATVSLIAFSIYASINAENQRQLAHQATDARDRERLSKEEAIRSREEAIKAKEDAIAARAQALSELTQANIERGRLEAATGNLALAEDTLWREYFNDPQSASARWGLWELYDRIPSQWIVQGPAVSGLPVVSADQRSIAWVSSAGRVVAFDVKSGGKTLDIASPVPAPLVIAISPDGDNFFMGSSRNDAIVFSRSGESHNFAGSIGVRGAIFSADGNFIATAGPGTLVRLWDNRTCGILREWQVGGAPRHLAFSADGTFLAAGSDSVSRYSALNVLNTQTGDLVADLSPPDGSGVSALTFESKTNRLVVAHRPGNMSFWEVGDTTLTPSSHVSAGTVIALTCAPDDRAILMAAQERPFIMSTQGVMETRPLPRQRYSVVAAAWAGDNEATMVIDGGLLRRCSLSTNVSASRITGFESWCFSVTYSAGGTMMGVGAGDGTIDTIDLTKRRRLARWSIANTGFRTRQVHFIDSDRTMLAACHDGVLRGLDPNTGAEQFALPGERSECFALDVSPDGRYAAVGHSNRVTRIFDLHSKEKAVTLPTLEKRIESVAFSPDGKLLAVSGLARGIALWDVDKKEIARRVETTTQPWGVAFSPDGSRMFVSTQLGTIEVFKAPDWTPERVLRGHQRLIPAIAVSPDGKLFATGGEDSLVKIWDAVTLRNLASFDTNGLTIVSLAFSPDSKKLAGAAANRFIVEYDLAGAEDRIRAHEDYYRRRLAPAKPATRQ